MSLMGPCLLLLAGIGQTLPVSSSTARVIYLNGADISSAKNQSLEQVNVRIDGRGNVYIEAPQYEVQQESTFVPLSRQTPAHPNLPVHRSPGPLPNEVEMPASKGDLASPAETGDTMNQPESAPPTSAAASGLMEKEGIRKEPDGNPSKEGTGASLSPGVQPNP
ncbi:MAG: hypothetical protein M3Q07_22645 [Pseudobdellovibrionaceae bacterium]|nr:hypothetical protein [Pseudobdellovibrionaceae bacterium]